MSTKVIIEITAKGWETKILTDGKEYVEKHITTRSGSESTGILFEDNDEINEEYEELIDALGGFFQHDVATKIHLYHND